jgi:hypothetical protein
MDVLDIAGTSGLVGSGGVGLIYFIKWYVQKEISQRIHSLEKKLSRVELESKRHTDEMLKNSETRLEMRFNEIKEILQKIDDRIYAIITTNKEG